MCSTCEKIGKGVMGLCNAALGRDRAPQIVINARREKCGECDQVTNVLGARFCICGCLIVAKTSLAGEECPLPADEKKWGKWPAEPAAIAGG